MSSKRKETVSTDAKKSKKPKLASSNSDKKPNLGIPQFDPSLSKRERRIQTKEFIEARKKRRRPNYTLEKELGALYFKMMRPDIGKEDLSKMTTEALQKMKGKIPEFARTHVVSRVLQVCVKHCSKKEKEAVFKELEPHFFDLATNAYAAFLLKKMMDVSRQQLAFGISSLRGHVAALLRHPVGSAVVEHAYDLGNAAQKQELIGELYSAELKLFKSLSATTEKTVVDVIAKLGLQKGSVVRHMTAIIQPILEKGIVDHSIIHKLLFEYLTIADKTSSAYVLQQLTGNLLERMAHTRDGSRLAMLCIKHGSAKERKKIIKAMKERIERTASDQFGCMVVACIFSIVDDTKLVIKTIVRGLEPKLKDLVMCKNGRKSLLQLLHPNSPRYFSHDDLASFDLSVPSLCSPDKSETSTKTKDSDGTESGDEEMKDEEEDAVTELSDNEDNVAVVGSKKDPILRRQELLVSSGLAERLIDVCVENTEEILKSNFGKEVLYEIVTGGSDGILIPSLSDKLGQLYEAIASEAAKPKPEGSEKLNEAIASEAAKPKPEEPEKLDEAIATEAAKPKPGKKQKKKSGEGKSGKPEKNLEHVLENFQSSRTIRRLVLACPSFASTLFNKALSGKCRSWAQGHCAKILSAFLETEDLQVREMAKEELQVLVDEGILKISETKKSEC